MRPPNPFRRRGGSNLERVDLFGIDAERIDGRGDDFRIKTALEVQRVERGDADAFSALNVPEQMLWDQIRGCRLGVWFRPQVVIGRFIADFVAPRAQLIVEVDGGYHAARAGADARRDRKLARMVTGCCG